MRLRLLLGTLACAAAATLVVSCTSDLYRRAPGTTSSAVDFCAEAESVSSAMAEFNSSQSQMFDDAAATAAANLISEARRVAQRTERTDIVATLTGMADAVQTIIDHVEGSSASDVGVTRKAAAEYLRFVQDYQSLLDDACGTE